MKLPLWLRERVHAQLFSLSNTANCAHQDSNNNISALEPNTNSTCLQFAMFRVREECNGPIWLNSLCVRHNEIAECALEFASLQLFSRSATIIDFESPFLWVFLVGTENFQMRIIMAERLQSALHSTRSRGKTETSAISNARLSERVIRSSTIPSNNGTFSFVGVRSAIMRWPNCSSEKKTLCLDRNLAAAATWAQLYEIFFAQINYEQLFWPKCVYEQLASARKCCSTIAMSRIWNGKHYITMSPWLTDSGQRWTIQNYREKSTQMRLIADCEEYFDSFLVHKMRSRYEYNCSLLTFLQSIY